MDFRKIPYVDNFFKLIVFDPPHMNSLGKNSWMAKKYGVLGETWRDDLRKGFFVRCLAEGKDTSEICYLLGINSVNELKNHFAYGNIYENLIISEVNKKIYNNKLPLKIYFYRDSNQIEVDLIIDSGSVLHYCEIKSAKTFNKDFLKSLETISENIGLPAQKFVVYRGDLKQSVNGIKLIGFEDLEELFQGL